MPFDWINFFDVHHIEYKTSGANTSRDNVTIHCPFCGSADPSHHMSVNLSGKGFRCWRSPTHRGIDPTGLVSALLNIPFDRARDMTGGATVVPDDFANMVQTAMGREPKPAARPPLKMPSEFKVFSGLPSSKPYVRYMRDERKFSDNEIGRATLRWNVRYCTMGAYRGRIIFPVHYKGKLVAWTGRTIYAGEELRYKALSTDPERAEREGYKPAIGAISHYLLWFDELRASRKPDTIILTEGPFDALKINVLGRKYGILATCCFTSTPTDRQVSFLYRLLPRFKRRYTLFDAGTYANTMLVGNVLSSLDVIPARLPPRLKDPGEFTVSTFDQFMLTL